MSEYEQIISFLSKKMTLNEISNEMNFSKTTLKRRLKKYNIKIKNIKENFSDKCKHCDRIVDYKSYERKDVFCSLSCSNKRTHNQITKNKISNKLKNFYLKNKTEKCCLYCNIDISNKRKKNLFCSRSCAIKKRIYTDEGKELIKRMVSKSIETQNRRSKNEVLFYNECLKHFKSVDHNINIFNGWDADIIINDIKFAILWNGIWHYKKITKKHSVLQVQNRDLIKLKEIEKYGYTPYVIKDMGKVSTKKVSIEFNKFIEYLKCEKII